MRLVLLQHPEAGVGGADGAVGAVGAALLKQVHQLVDQQDSTGSATGVVMNATHRDLMAVSQGVDADLVQRRILGRPGSHAHVAEVATQCGLHHRAHVGVGLAAQLPEPGTATPPARVSERAPHEAVRDRERGRPRRSRPEPRRTGPGLGSRVTAHGLSPGAAT